jgi:hypothetical protein
VLNTFLIYSSEYLLLITAIVKFNKKKAPINTIGTKNAIAYAPALFHRLK